MMLGYVDPGSASFVLSAIAGIGGVFLLGWRWITKKCRAVYRFVFRIKVVDE